MSEDTFLPPVCNLKSTCTKVVVPPSPSKSNTDSLRKKNTNNKAIRVRKKRKSKLQPVDEPYKLADTSEHKVSASTELNRKTCCMKALVNGYVNSYVELFYLTHCEEPDANTPSLLTAAMDDTQQQNPIQFFSPDKLKFLKTQLTTCESCHRQGDSVGMFKAYERIADQYVQQNKYTTAIYFYDKCAEIAVMMQDPHRQITASHKLGISHDAIGDTKSSIRFHEQHLELARKNNLADDIKRASSALVEMYAHEARKSEAKNDVSASVVLLTKCLEAAMSAEDPQAEGIANHRLGLAMVSLGDSQAAIRYQKNFLDVCKETQDVSGEAQAHAALATAYRQLHNSADAIKSLNVFLKIATERGAKESQARAYAELGTLYNDTGDQKRAVECFEQNYSIICALNSHRKQANDDITLTIREHRNQDLARVQLGTARGNLLSEHFFDVINSDTAKLLTWKSNRSGMTMPNLELT